MTEQLSLFDTLRRPMIVRPVDPDGPVLQGEADCTFLLQDPHRPSRQARIELHPTLCRLWMWGTYFQTGTTGAGYRVGEKWGHFAASPEDALHYALEELRGRLTGLGRGHDRVAWRILSWAEAFVRPRVSMRESHRSATWP